DAQHAQLFRTRFPGFGFLLGWNTHRFGGRVFSALRLYELLWPVRFYLYSARPFRLPALRCAGELLPAACLLHDRLSPGADHGAISSAKSDTSVSSQSLPTCLRSGHCFDGLRGRVAKAIPLLPYLHPFFRRVDPCTPCCLRRLGKRRQLLCIVAVAGLN